MRDLKANQKTIWYQNSSGFAAVKDEYGNRTGEEQPIMEHAEQLKISVSGAVGAMRVYRLQQDSLHGKHKLPFAGRNAYLD